MYHMKNVFFGEKGKGGSEKKDKETFLLSYFSVKKSSKRKFSFNVLFACPKRTKRTKRGKY